ncbi:mechanosensitive ion channel [Candidatus Poribacteria bacterium]|nr:mechanosensitive ion channel [Candidatus Poribacteria bacterium]
MWNKYDGFIYGVLSIIVLVILFKVMTKMLRRYTEKQSFKEENELAFLRRWQYAYIFIAVAICATAFSGEIQAMGITMAFLGSIMAWMLSAPVRNMAGWLFLVISRPFKVLDRVIIGGVTGDVVDITINFIVLDQVGGTTTGEEKSGRGVLVPTSWLFSHIINNYSMKLPSDEEGQKYLLDEVVVRITYDSDWNEAERILKSVAANITSEAIKETGEEPYIRAEFFPSGVFMRIRYRVAPTDRQRVWSEIVRKVSVELDKSNKVFYCFNKSNVFVNYRDKEKYPPQLPINDIPVGGVK